MSFAVIVMIYFVWDLNWFLSVLFDDKIVVLAIRSGLFMIDQGEVRLAL